MRLIHSSSMHVLNGLASWVGNVLKAILATLPHCCTSSKQVINMLRSCRIGQRSVFMKADVKDFYMDSQHQSCVQNCVRAVSWHLAQGLCLPFVKEDCAFDPALFGDVLSFLLRSQYVDSSEPDILYHVICGSGMGMNHSSAVSSINQGCIAHNGVKFCQRIYVGR